MSRPATKPAAKTDDVVNFPSFDTSKAADQLRAFAEKGMEGTQEVYARFRSAAEDFQKSVDTSFESTRASLNELSLKTVAAARTNVEAGFSHLEALVSAKTFSEALELQSAFLRKSFETAVEQGNEFQASLTKALGEVGKPAREAFEQVSRTAKAA